MPRGRWILSGVWLALGVLGALLFVAVSSAGKTVSVGLDPAQVPASTWRSATTPAFTPTATATATQCPMPTPEPLWVEPVTSPTDLLSQIVTVRIGNGEAVTVTAESGMFSAAGSFDAYANPAQVSVTLLPSTVHHLVVEARVRRVTHWGGCVYGGYTLWTERDRYGNPLVIEQIEPAPTAMPATLRRYLPLLLAR